MTMFKILAGGVVAGLAMAEAATQSLGASPDASRVAVWVGIGSSVFSVGVTLAVHAWRSGKLEQRIESNERELDKKASHDTLAGLESSIGQLRMDVRELTRYLMGERPR